MAEDDLIKKWLNNELTDAEKEVFSKREDYALNQDIIEKAKHFKASNFSKVDDFETFKNNYNKQPKVRHLNWIKPLFRIAGLLVIALGIYFAFFNDDLIEAQALASEKTTISLPDLSQVTLNAYSKITCDASSWDSKRVLNLIGEAYFKVAKGKTFDVITKSGVVEVVGTEFNVKARQNYFEVVCYEGIVKVTSEHVSKKLLAGDTFRILNEEFSQDRTTDVAPQWIDNRSRFKAVPLAQVIAELERQYKVGVSFKNVNSTRLFTGVFVHNNLENALSAITKPMNLTFEISSPNQVLIHGNTD